MQDSRENPKKLSQEQYNQDIKADAGKPRLSLVESTLIEVAAKIEEYQQDNTKPIFIEKTEKIGKNWKGRFECPYCGKEFEALLSNVMRGKTKSCGCAKGRLKVQTCGTHGDARTRLYRIWRHINDRCNNPKCKEYKWYGARGIKNEFDNYQIFKEFALSHGYNDNLTTERVDVNGNYSPTNIIFIPLEIQQQNTRSNIMLTYKGLTLCAAEWGRIVGINSDTLTKRKRRGWSDEKVLEKKVNKENLNIQNVPIAIIDAIRQTRLYGIAKYGKTDSWKQVEPERYRDAASRHLIAYINDPKSVDEESGLPHLWHLATNIAFLCELEKNEINNSER